MKPYLKQLYLRNLITPYLSHLISTNTEWSYGSGDNINTQGGYIIFIFQEKN